MKSKILAVTLFVFAGVVWFSQPAWRAHKEKKFSGQAGEALAKKDYRLALLSAQQVLVLNSNNLGACLVMAELADMSQSPNSMVWRRRIADLEPTLSNKIVFAATALRYEKPPFPITAQTLNGLAATGQNNANFHLVLAQLALKQGRPAESEKELEQAIALDPKNDLNRVNLAIVRLESADAAVSARARAELEQWQTNAVTGVQALRALMVHHAGRRQFAEAERYSTALLRNPNSTFNDKLEHLAVLRGAQSPQFDSFLATVKREVGTNVFSAAELVTQLTSMGAADKAIDWVKSLPPAMQKEAPLPLALASSYFVLGQWRELEVLLGAQPWKERDFARQALLAYATRKQNAMDASIAHWKNAVQLAATRPELLGSLAQMSSTWGWTNETEAVLWRVIRDFPKEGWPVDSLQTSYVQLKNTRKLYELNAAVLERQPTNTFAQNNWAALSFLLETNLAKAHEIAKTIYDRDTKNVGFASTYAWSLQLQGRTADALKVIEAIPAATLEQPSLAAYYGAVLAAAGQKEKARSFLDKSATAPLLPEEVKMVADARKKL